MSACWQGRIAPLVVRVSKLPHAHPLRTLCVSARNIFT